MNDTNETSIASGSSEPQLWQGVTLILTDFIILSLNSFAMVIIFRFKQRLIPDVLIFSLACTDLAKGIFPIPMTVGVYMGWWKLSEETFGCKLFAWAAFTTNSGAMLVLTLMSCDRYIAICWPFEYKSRITLQKVCYIVTGLYIYAGIHSLLPVLGIGDVSSFRKDTFCHFDFDSIDKANKAYSIYILVLGFSMLMLVVFCYSRSMCKVRGLIQRSQRRMCAVTKGLSQSKQDAARNRINYMFARMMLVFMISFLVSWLLFMIVVLSHVTKWFSISDEAHFWSMRLAVLNSVLNPIIGAAMYKPYRRGYKYILYKLCCCCAHNPQNPWSRKRHSSVSIPSREKSDTISKAQEESPQAGVTCNVTFGNYAHDSGIVSDSVEAQEKTAGSKGSWRLNQEFDISVGQDKQSMKSGLSFDDELGFYNGHCKEPSLNTKERKNGGENGEENNDCEGNANGGGKSQKLAEHGRTNNETKKISNDITDDSLGNKNDFKKDECPATELAATSLKRKTCPTLLRPSNEQTALTSANRLRFPHRTFSLPVVQLTHFPMDSNWPFVDDNGALNRKYSHSLNDLPQTNYCENQTESNQTSQLGIFNVENKSLDIVKQGATKSGSVECILSKPCEVVNGSMRDHLKKNQTVLQESQTAGLEMSNFARRRHNSETIILRSDGNNGDSVKLSRNTPPLSLIPLNKTSRTKPTGIAMRLKAPFKDEQRKAVLC